MSQIPKAGGSKPLIKTTSTVTSKTPSGGTKTTTTTKIRELQPCTSGSGSQTVGCQPCPPSRSGQRSIRPPQGASGSRPPAMAPRSAPISRARPSGAGRAPAMQPSMPGEYNVPAQFGPMSRPGKGMTFSSPAGLRGQMDAKVPKEVKYGGVKTCPYTGGKQREALQGTRMGNTLAGNFNVYGGPMVSEEMVDRNVLDERVYSPKMANKPKSCKHYHRTSKAIADAPLPIDLSREISSVFDLRCRKQERISDYMCRNIRKTKLKALQKMAKIDVIPSITRPTTSKEIRVFSENCPITDMSRFQEKSIRQKIHARGLDKQYPELLNDIMKDTKLEFRKITHFAGVNLKVKDKYPEDFKIQNYKFLGKTDNYQQFLCIKKQFGMRWLLHYEIMRQFLKECVSGLPYVLFQLEFQQILEFEDLQYVFREKIHSSAAIFHDFHKSVYALFDKSDGGYKKLSSKILSACTGLLSIYVSKIIAHTMENIVKFTESVDIAPYLQLYVDFESSLVLTPTEEQVTGAFQKLLDDLISVGKELNVMERGRVKGYESKTICLCLTDEFIEKCKKDITDNISKLYQPISGYLDKLGSDFAEIYADINSNNVFQNTDVLFEEGCQKIQYYKKFINKVAYVPNKEYFKIGQLDLTNYREKLHDSLQMISDSFFKNLSAQHLWEVNDICDSFQLIKVRATQKPLTTEELIEIGKFMSWVKNEQLDELNERVHASLSSLCNIITLGILEEDHMNLNSAAMNWIEDITPIIEKHSVIYEQLKFEAEDKLQRVIEDINVMITDMYPLLVILDEMDDIKLARMYLSKITLHMAKIKEIQLRIEWINSEEVCLSFPKSGYVEFENLKDYVYPFYHLLKLSLDVQKHVSVWQYGQFDLLDYASANETVEKLCKELEETQKGYRKKLRQAQDENLPIRFKGTVDDPDLLNWPAPLKLCGMSLNILEEFKPSLTVMRIMCNDALRPRHWRAMSEIAGFNLMPNAGTTLKKMMGFDLHDKLNEYEIISTCATKEQQLLDQLNSLKAQWQTIDFVTNQVEDTWILIGLDHVQTIVDEHVIKILNMRSSVFVKPYEKDVLDFYDTISKISSVISNWIILQNVYLKLFPIFSLADVVEHIPNEKRHFEECDFVFKKYTRIITETPRVVAVVSQTNIVEDLNKSLVTLEEVQRGINTYLEVMRLRCPRLYFISNEELINLIALNNDFSDQSFLIKIFSGIKRVNYNNDQEVTALVSSCGEEITLKNKIDLKSENNFDQFVNDLESEMLNSMKHKTAHCYKIYKKTTIKELIKKYPQQSLQLMSRIFWTDQVENALKLSHNIKLLIYKRKLEENIDEKIDLINQSDLNNVERTTLKNLLLTDINNKYLLNSFVKDGVVIDDTHFDWQVQLKYYFQKSLCSIQILKQHLDYCYEYFGNTDTIILTPLTDKCFVTLLNAYFHNFFGFVKGRSQTGKHVTTESLAGAIGKLFFPLNCISTLSAESLLQILKGTAMCGSWLSLKNIHHLKAEVLSVISQDLLSILECKKIKSKELLFGGAKLPFDYTCFVMVQMPMESACKLPENFRLMFRTFTLCQPDLKIVIDGLFALTGIKDYKLYSSRMQHCFALLEDILSCEKQHIFKLREAKQVLTIFEKNKCLTPSQDNFTLLCNSFQEVFSPSLVDADSNILENILSEVFQDFYSIKRYVGHKTLADALVGVTLQSNLSTDDNFIKKVVDLYECLKTGRSSIILLGDTNTAKTTILKLCVQLLKKLDDTDITLHIINPKCVDYNNLVGEVSMDKNIRWTDGVLLKILRHSQGKEGTTRNWILFDGYIDKTWTEDFAHVLENGKLYLETLEIMMFGEEIKLLFESTSLENASPSMVSRCTTVYFPRQTLSNILLVEAWTKKCKSDWLIEHRIQIEALFKWFLPPCLEFINNVNLKHRCNLDDNTMVKNVLIYFQLLLDDASSKVNKKEEDPKNMSAWIHATFIQAGVLGFSSFLPDSLRQKFDEFYKQLWRGQNDVYPHPKCLERLEVGLPSEGILFDYCYLYKQRGTWKLWADLLKNEKIIDTPYMSSYIIPTIDTMRCNFLLDLHIKYGKHFLIFGPKSTGKSISFKDCYINRLPEKLFEKANITFNNRLTAQAFQKLVLSKLNRKTTGYYSASCDKRFICFLDDVHYSSKDDYNVSSALELLRQHLDHNVWYDLKSFKAIFLEKINFYAASGLSGDKPLPQRFLRHFNLFGINEFTHDNIAKIYSQILALAWKKSGFPSDILTAVNQMVYASLSIYTLVQQNLKPTLSRCHYAFDMTSLSKVIQACTFLKKETYDGNKKIYVKLWVHEIFRVFADRFYLEDIKYLTNAVKEALAEHFADDDLNDIFMNYEEELPFSQLFFGTFQDKSLDTSLRHYEEVNFQSLGEMCVQCLRDYNEQAQFKLDLQFFNYALEKLARICRLLSMPNENALLLGATGCGRQSLTKFASFMYNYEFYQAMIIRDYDETNWNSDFKHILKRSGGLDIKCVFLVAEEQLINETFFEAIDYYIRDGEITDLYDMDEKQDILELSRLAAQGGNRNLDISSHKVFLYFNKKCRENFRLLLSLNSTSNRLRMRIFKYPSLATRFNIIMWEKWPDNALHYITKSYLNNIQLPDDIKEKTISAAIYFHRTCQSNMFVTPKAYIHLNALFVDLITKKQKSLTLKKNRFQQGLAKLSYAATQISDMQKSLAEYQPLLAEMTKNAIEMTEQIALESIEVEKASALVRKDEEIASEQAVIAQVLKSECESELAQAIPILEDAISALNTLKPSDITLVKSMKNPPDAIKLVMASVCVIKDVKPDRIPDPSTGRKTIDYWGPSKRILGDMNFLQTLKDFDKDHIKPEVMVKIRKEYLPHKDFKPHVVAKASSAAEGLCKWIIAMDMYDRVAKEVAPKKEKLNKAERDYAQTMLVLNQKKEEVLRIEEKLAQLNVLLDEAIKKQVKLQVEVDLCNKKLNSAQKLISSLSGERLRWTSTSEDLQKHYDVLAGDILLSSAIIAYLPSLHNDHRNEKLLKWRDYIRHNNIPVTENFNFSSVLSSDTEIEHWTEHGLPSDPFFIENAVIFNNSKYFRLLLDPHGQALQWILGLESGNNIIVTKFSYVNWLSNLKYCITQGKPILIVDTKGHIPPCLNSFIYGQTFNRHDDVFVTVDGEDIQIHKSSRIYIVCDKPNVSYSSELRSRLTIINFSLTRSALRDDVLRIVVEIEKPAIRKLSEEFVQRNRENKSEQKQLEVKILSTLCESETDILDDQESILILDKSKELINVVVEKQENTKKIVKVINEFREKYISVAQHVVCLFFCVNDLQKLHHIYQFSFKWFKNIYFMSIINAGKSKNLDIRCQNLCDTFTYDLYKSVSKGLFEKDKLLFTFWLAAEVAVSKGIVTKEEIAIFFKTRKRISVKEESGRPAWVSKEMWSNLHALEQMEMFKGIVESFVDDPMYWKHYLESSSEEIPNSWNAINHFGRLIFIQVLKPDKLYYEIINFIKTVLGENFLLPMFFNIQEIFNETYSLVPVLFILTSGLDVLDILKTFASVKQVLHKFHHLSLDESNSKRGEQLIKQGRVEGCWVLLQNCQYTKDWLYRLEQDLQNMDFQNTDENFRLFLTIDDKHDIPLELIQNSIKIIDESPSNLRKNLLKIYDKNPIVLDDYFYGCPGKQEYFSKLLFRLCYFHFLLQERQSILNWNLLYKFEDPDLLLSLELLRSFVNEGSCLYEKIYFLIGECNYNGSLENDWEKTFVSELLKECINDKMFEKTNAVSSALKPYCLPTKNDRRDYFNHIYKLPHQDPPEVLYLTEYELSRHRLWKTSRFLDRGMKLIQVKEECMTAAEENNILSIIDDLLSKLPEKAYYKKFKEGGNEYMIREISLYNRLLNIIRYSIEDIKSAFQGEKGLSESQEEIAVNLSHNKVPKIWHKSSYPSLLNLSAFAKTICENISFLENYDEVQKRFLLRAFFFPKSIISYAKLRFARKFNVILDDIELECKALLDDENLGDASESNIIFDGLFMFGARFDTGDHQIVDLAPKTYYSPLPPLLVMPAILNKRSGLIPSAYKCGIFKTQPFLGNSDYEFLPGTPNFITNVGLNFFNKKEFWIKRGVSIICEIDI